MMPMFEACQIQQGTDPFDTTETTQSVVLLCSSVCSGDGRIESPSERMLLLEAYVVTISLFWKIVRHQPELSAGRSHLSPQPATDNCASCFLLSFVLMQCHD